MTLVNLLQSRNYRHTLNIVCKSIPEPYPFFGEGQNAKLGIYNRTTIFIHFDRNWSSVDLKRFISSAQNMVHGSGSQVGGDLYSGALVSSRSLSSRSLLELRSLSSELLSLFLHLDNTMVTEKHFNFNGL